LTTARGGVRDDDPTPHRLQALDNDTIVQWTDVEHGFYLLELIEKKRDSAFLTARLLALDGCEC